jgi:hypothetical protein
MRAEIPDDLCLEQLVEKNPSKITETEPVKTEEKQEDELDKVIENEAIENKLQDKFEEPINVKNDLIKKHKNFTVADGMKARERLVKSKE